MKQKKNLNKFSKIKVNSDAISSRFLIDLKDNFLVENNKEKKNFVVESKLEKLAEINYRELYQASKNKIKSRALDFKDNLLSFKAVSRLNNPSVKPATDSVEQPEASPRAESLIDELSFVFLAKIILIIFNKLFKWFYRLCYLVGWFALFALKFIYLFLIAIFRPIIKPINYIFKKLQFIKIDLYSIKGLFLKKQLAVETLDQKDEFYQENKVEDLSYQGVSENTSLLRPVFVFATVLLIIILPIKAYTYYQAINDAKGRVLGASESAVNNLISGGQSAANLDFNQADKSFTLASRDFLSAQNQLAEINESLFTLASIIPNKDLQLAAASKNIIRAGELGAQAGKNLSLAVGNIFKPENTKSILEDLSAYGHKTLVNLSDLSNELEQINGNVIPREYRDQFVLLKQKITALNRGLSKFIGIADNLGNFLGVGSFKRYLLVFQNNSELRASGGFIGSFALVDYSNGKIKNISAPKGGSYDTDAGLLKKIKSPEPLRLIRPDWHFWDANWWPDWAASAKKLAWFYENSDGSTVDGVISFTPTVMEKILRVIGPIDLTEQYNLIIDADNFWLETQKLAEQKPNITKEPKKIIGDLLNKIIEELPKRLSKDNIIGLLGAVEESLTDKNILFYFSDDKLQLKSEELGWAGEIKDTAGDYLSVINTNIAGGKSDRAIKQEITHQAEVRPDGAIIDTLTIRRTHEAINRQPFSGVRNVDWLRVYAPLGSKLISASGFRPVDKIFFKEADQDWKDDPDILRSEGSAATDELSGTKIYSEFNKTVFANWSQVDPGESIEIILKYQLPFKLTFKKAGAEKDFVNSLVDKAGVLLNLEEKNYYSYSLMAQKQPGMNNSLITSELKLSHNFKPIWQYPGDLAINEAGWFRTEIFDQDKLIGIMIEEL